MIGQTWLLVLLAVLAVARMTHLLTTDQITDRPRAWVQEHAGDNLAYLVTCPWCLSVYVGLGTASAVYAWHGHWWVQIPLLGLAASQVTGGAETLLGLVNACHELAEAMTVTEQHAVQHAEQSRPGPPAY